MNLNTTVTLGDIITVIAFMITLYGFHIKNVERFAKLETKVDIMWDRLKARLGMAEYEEN